MLKRNNLKLASYPFDWIFANLETVIDCIQDNFEALLDKTYYTIEDINSKSQQHSLYFSNDNEHVFNHHNPLKVEDYNYFVRCIQRFQNLLKKKELKLFVLNFLNYYPLDENLKKDIIELNNLLKTKTQNYGILCIVHYVAPNYKHKFTVHENIHFLEITTPSSSNGLEFLSKQDNDYLDHVITTTYKFSLKEIEKIQKVYEETINNDSHQEENVLDNIISEQTNITQENTIPESNDESTLTIEQLIEEKLNKLRELIKLKNTIISMGKKQALTKETKEANETKPEEVSQEVEISTEEIEQILEQLIEEINESEEENVNEIKIEIVEETKEELIDETKEELIEETKEEIVNETKKELIDETKEELIEETKEELIEETKKELIDETKEELIEETKEELIEETKEELIEETKEELIEETKEELIEETKKELIDETKKELIEETKEELIEETNDTDTLKNDLYSYKKWKMGEDSTWYLSNNE
jgi:hypothetical protein